MFQDAAMAKYPAQAMVVDVSLVVGIIDTVAVVLRLVARKRSKATFAVDDVLIIFSILPLYGMVALSHLSTSWSIVVRAQVDRLISSSVAYKAGLGQPITTLTPAQLNLFMKVCWREVY